MTEPRRLIETEQGLAHALLEHGVKEKPSSRTRTKVAAAAIAAVGTVGTASTVAGTAAAASLWKAGWLSVVAWTSVGAISAGAVVATYHATEPSASRAPLAAVSTSVAAPSESSPIPFVVPSVQDPAAVSSATPEPTVTSVPMRRPPSTEALPSSMVEPPASAAASVPNPVQADTLLGEVAQIDQARQALARGNPEEALRVLDTHSASGTALVAEGLVLRIESLLKKGDREGAAGAAEKFLSTYPNSPHKARVQSMLAAAQNR